MQIESSVIDSKIPEYIRNSSPRFADFIKIYYDYASQREKAIGTIKYTPAERDVDEASDARIDEYYSTYGQYLPKTLALDKRNFLKLLNEVYNAKGTEKALHLLFRALYGEEISVSYPSENILKASDGIWERESFITTTTLYGSLSSTDVVQFKNIFGEYYITPTRVETVGTELSRIYFKTYRSLNVVDDQEVFVYSGPGIMKYAGRIVKTMENLSIQNSGKAWQQGQVIVIPGTGKNSIARITGINSTGGITKLEILEYGYEHSPGQVTTISPYPNKPVGSVIDYTSTLVSINPNVYHHSLKIKDFTDGMTESITAVSDGISPRSYFLENYVQSGYNGQLVISNSSTLGPSNNSSQDLGVTIEEWIASRATLVATMANVVTTKGYYRNENGQLSNQQIRIEDNYFYQAFSYLLETSRDISEYRNILNITHPAGMKAFSAISKSNDFSVGYEISRVLSNDSIYLIDKVFATSSNRFGMLKPLSSAATVSDSLNSKKFTKVLTSSVGFTEFVSRKFGKKINDAVSIGDLGTSNLVTTPIVANKYDGETYFLETYVTIPNNYQLTLN